MNEIIINKIIDDRFKGKLTSEELKDMKNFAIKMNRNFEILEELENE
jgi:hypothetical protein